MDQLSTFLKVRPDGVTFASWGAYDSKQLRSDCEYYGYKYPFTQEFNIKAFFQDVYDVRTSVKKALNKLKFKFEGTPHRGIDDARNIARILKRTYDDRRRESGVRETADASS